MSQKINIVLFGIGNIGSALINKAVKNREALLAENNLDIRFPVITNSTVAFFGKEGKGYEWEANFIQFAIPFKLGDVVNYVQGLSLENLIAVDATGSIAFTDQYAGLVKSGFSIVSVNENMQKLPPGILKKIKADAAIAGLSFTYVDAKETANKTTTALLEAVIKCGTRKVLVG